MIAKRLSFFIIRRVISIEIRRRRIRFYFFDRQGVLEDLLRVQRQIHNEDSSSEEITFDHRDEDTDGTSESNTDDGFNDNVTTLRDFSFISISENMTVFMMHRRTW
ncbi:Tetratricopeptide-like helical [Penicillium sp. IBT 16267x]|nr:Tetratricopeptide-like helical [Penicillium sp. IBT 16267x]